MSTVRKKIFTRFIVAAIGFAWMLTLIVSSAEAGQQGNKDIKLKKSDGTEVTVPASGPLSDQTAQNVAAGVLSFDKEAKLWKSKQAKNKSVDPAVAGEMQAIALEARNDSVEQLDLAYRVAKRSAGGGLDVDLLGGAQKDIGFAKEIMQTTPPDSLFVRTDIFTPQGTLHYCTKVEHRENPISWHSYNSGKKLHIGMYVFRTDPTSGTGEPYEEEVLVLADPTSVKIVPLH